MKRLLLIILLTVGVALQGGAQELEYQMELGGGIGPSFYLGDVSSTPFASPSAMFGAVARKILNPRMAIKGNLAYAQLRGDSEGIFIPTDPGSMTPEGGLSVAPIHFKRNVLDLGAQFEFNFWGYGTGEGYKGHSRITPYALAGLGFTLAPGSGNTIFALNAPFGLGVKYKLMPRVNVGAEWTFRFSTSDALDVTREQQQLIHPYGINSSGFKNKDCYSFLMFYITYDMCPKLRKCNND